MKSIISADEIEKVRSFYHLKQYDKAIVQLHKLSNDIKNESLYAEIKEVCSKYYEYQRQELFMSNPDEAEQNNHLEAILLLSFEIEKYFKSSAVSDLEVDISSFSNDKLLSVLNLFNSQTKEKHLSPLELADVVDTKIKLYNLIFKDFDSSLELRHKENIGVVMFDRIIQSLPLQKSEHEIINNIRINQKYSSNDRELIVGGLTVSLINKFDSARLSLLIDFLTDFEEPVWNNALVGIVLCLTHYDNRISLFPEILRRLKKLKEIDKVQEGIVIIERILRKKLYSPKEVYMRDKGAVLRKCNLMIGNAVELTKQELLSMDEALQITNKPHDIYMMEQLFSSEKRLELLNKMGKQSSITMTVEEFFSFVNMETFLTYHELNPFLFDVKSEIYTTAKNWFLPFQLDDDMKEMLANNFKVNSIDIASFVEILKNSTFYNIDKFHILLNIGTFTDDFVELLHSLCAFEAYYNREHNVSNTFVSYLSALRNIYRFFKLGIGNHGKSIFDNTSNIYKKSLLQKISDKLTNDKINSRILYDEEKYTESLKILTALPLVEHDREVLELLYMNYYTLGDIDKSVSTINQILERLQLEHADNRALYEWQSKLSSIYFRNGCHDKYNESLKKEIEFRQKNLQNALHQFPNDEKCIDDGIALAESYFNASVNAWNILEDKELAFFYRIKSIEALRSVSFARIEVLNKILESRKAGFESYGLSICQAADIHGRINEFRSSIDKISDQKLISNIDVLFRETKWICAADLKDFLSSQPTEYGDLRSRISEHYKNIIPIVRSINKTHPNTSAINVPLADDEESFKIQFNIQRLLNEGEPYLFDTIVDYFNHIAKERFIKHWFQHFWDSSLATDELHNHVSIEMYYVMIVRGIEATRIPST